MQDTNVFHSRKQIDVLQLLPDAVVTVTFFCAMQMLANKYILSVRGKLNNDAEVLVWVGFLIPICYFFFLFFQGSQPKKL